jgi:hypothetical protein
MYVLLYIFFKYHVPRRMSTQILTTIYSAMMNMMCFFTLAVEVGARIRGEAKMMAAVACATVPKLSVIIGNCIGNYTMVSTGLILYLSVILIEVYV